MPRMKTLIIALLMVSAITSLAEPARAKRPSFSQDKAQEMMASAVMDLMWEVPNTYLEQEFLGALCHKAGRVRYLCRVKIIGTREDGSQINCNVRLYVGHRGWRYAIDRTSCPLQAWLDLS